MFVADLSCRTQPVVSRSPIVSAPEPSLSVKFVVTKSRLSSLSGSFPSNVLSVKLHKILRYVQILLFYIPLLIHFFLRPTSASNHRPSWPSKKQPRHTSFLYSKTPILPLSTPSVSPSNQKILHWLVDCGESGHRFPIWRCSSVFYLYHFPVRTSKNATDRTLRAAKAHIANR
jgi:hypothetical protein